MGMLDYAFAEFDLRAEKFHRGVDGAMAKFDKAKQTMSKPIKAGVEYAEEEAGFSGTEKALKVVFGLHAALAAKAATTFASTMAQGKGISASFKSAGSVVAGVGMLIAKHVAVSKALGVGIKAADHYNRSMIAYALRGYKLWHDNAWKVKIAIGLMAAPLRAAIGLTNRAAGAMGRLARMVPGGPLLSAFAVGGTLALGLGYTVHEAANLESQISQIRKTSGMEGDMKSGPLGSLVAQLDELSRNLPVARKDLFDIAAMGGRQGLADQALVDYTKAVAMISVALDDIPAEESATQVGKILNNFKLGTEYALGFGSALNKMDDSSNASARAIMQATLGMSGMAQAMDMTAQEALALSTSLIEAGMAPETAGTAATQIMRRMAAETGKFSKIAGMEVEEFTRLVRTKPLEALQALSLGIAKMREEEGGAAAIALLAETDVKDQQQTQMLLAQFGKLSERVKQANHEFVTHESIQGEVSVVAEQTWKQLQLLGNQFGIAAGKIGSAFLPALKAIVSHIGGVAERIGKLVDGGALDGFADKIRKVADVIGMAFSDTPGTMELMVSAFESMASRVELIFDNLMTGLEKRFFSLISSMGKAGLEVVNFIGPASGIAGAGLSKLANVGKVQEFAQKDGRSEELQRRIEEADKRTAELFERQAKRGEEARGARQDSQLKALETAPTPEVAASARKTKQEKSVQDYVNDMIGNSDAATDEFAKTMEQYWQDRDILIDKTQRQMDSAIEEHDWNKQLDQMFDGASGKLKIGSSGIEEFTRQFTSAIQQDDPAKEQVGLMKELLNIERQAGKSLQRLDEAFDEITSI